MGYDRNAWKFLLGDAGDRRARIRRTPKKRRNAESVALMNARSSHIGTRRGRNRGPALTSGTAVKSHSSAVLPFGETEHHAVAAGAIVLSGAVKHAALALGQPCVGLSAIRRAAHKAVQGF